jgi:hypothetical protein
LSHFGCIHLYWPVTLVLLVFPMINQQQPPVPF